MNIAYNKISEGLSQQFKKIVGEENFFSEYEIRWTYAFGGTIFEKSWIPDLILMPKSLNQISEVLKIANQYKIPVTARGSGTSLSAGTMTPYGGIILDLSLMNKILNIDIENNLVEIEPGVICDDLNDKLKVYGYFFPPDPGSSSVCTIGGMVATNAGGVQAFKYGVSKNYVLGLEVVLADGKIITLGSKTLKSVSSYNLKDLFVGSEGTLGIITKVILRVIPLPKKRKLGFFIFDSIENLSDSAIELRKRGIIPNLLEFMDKVVSSAVYKYLGGEFLSYPEGYVLIAEIDGNNEYEVDEYFSKIFDIIIQKKPIFYKIAQNQEERERLIGARKANLPALSRIKPTTCVEDCTIKITDFSKVIREIEKIPQKINASNLIVAIICHMEGNLHPTFLFNENNEKDIKEFEKAIAYLYKEIIIPIGGTLTGEHGIGKIKSPYLELEHGSDVLNMMINIKKLLDPNFILNPGIGKGDIRYFKKLTSRGNLKNQLNKILEYSCMRCGFCIVTCPARIYYKSEAYSPRGRLSLLNGMVYGDINLHNKDLINDIFHSCTLCGLCFIKCPAGVKTYQIFEKVREILHNYINR